MEQHALRRIDAEALEQFRVPQRQLDHLTQRIDRVAHPAEIVIGDIRAALPFLGGKFGKKLDGGLAVDVHDPLGLRRDDHQAELLQRECRRIEQLPDMLRHVGIDALMARGRHRVALGERTAGEGTLQGVRGPLQTDIGLSRREDDPGGRFGFGLADFDEVA